MPKQSKPLRDYVLLGRTGLRVSPLCLGTMTFGNLEGWGADESESRRILDRYLDAGGNFIDTANVYAGGNSEPMVGRLLTESGKRDRVVVATKFSISTCHGDPNAGGNGRKNIYGSVETSLQRLGTDYIDLYWMHYWDTLTPVEEVMETLNDLVRSGKIRYFGFSDIPAWYMARAQTLAEQRGWSRIAAAQLAYSLIDRTIEVEHVVAAQELGIGIMPWGALGSGLLTGKYHQNLDQARGRIVADESYKRGLLNDRNTSIVEVVIAVAKDLGRSPAQIALNWIMHRPAVRSTLIGATSVQQLDENLAALDFEIPDALSSQLDEISHRETGHLYNFFHTLFGEHLRGAKVSATPAWDRR